MSSVDELNVLASLAHILGQAVDSGMSSSSAGPARAGSGGKVTYCSATCLDQQCMKKLFFPQHEASVVCPDCGQRHSVADLTDRKVLSGDEQRFGVEVSELRKKYTSVKKTAEQVRVNGVSNFQCKLLSPLLSTYGMGKDDQPYRLRDRNMGEVFDCSKLAHRSFSVEEHHLQVLGYGLDHSGSQLYLQDTLAQLQEANGSQRNLVPLHADGDGHCLVHAISRCLVGRELFWHALRSNLHTHLSTHLGRYRELFRDFYSQEEWEGLVAESAPDWKPPDGQSLGLSNLHIYGLANVLRRPIVLLDSLEGMRSSGDYSGIFLPSMFTPEECSYKDVVGATKLNPPLVIAWSSSGRNHFIPLIHVKGKPRPLLPVSLQPKVWGVAESLLPKYVEMKEDGGMEVYGGKELAQQYLLRLITCMDQLFLDQHHVSTSVVAEVDLYHFKAAGCVGVATETVIHTTCSAVEENRLFRCLVCATATILPADTIRPHGLLYQQAEGGGKLQRGHTLSFLLEGVKAHYDEEKDLLVPTEVSCVSCSCTSRRVRGNASVIYENGDRTLTPAVSSHCGCGFRHYWDGQEYDNLPERIPLSLTWNGKVESGMAHWFQFESDTERNSNVFQVANKIVSDKFPGEFGSERLVQQVVDQILHATASKHMEQVSHAPSQDHTPSQDHNSSQDYHTPPETYPASKMILTGPKSRTLHKEELGVSEAEKNVRRRVQDNARLTQNMSKKKTKYSPSNQDLPRKTTPPPTSNTPPKTTPPGKSQSSASPTHKRVRVVTSDGHTCNLNLEVGVTYTELLDTIEKELGVPPSRQKLRLGFPPRELVAPSDPAAPVALANGDKVSLEILPAPPSPAPPTNDVGVATQHQDHTQPSNSGMKDNADMLKSLIQQLVGKELDQWSLYQHQPWEFGKDGYFYRQVLQKFGDRVQHNTHIQFREMPGKTFAFNQEKECLELCLGLRHVPVGPLSVEEEELMVASSDDYTGTSSSAMPTSNISTATSGGSVIRASNTMHHVKAFSGRGHTLSTPTSAVVGKESTIGGAQPYSAAPNMLDQTPPTYAASGSDLLPSDGEAGASGRRGAENDQGCSGNDVGVAGEEPVERVQQQAGSPSVAKNKLEGLRDQRQALQNLVMVLQSKLLELAVHQNHEEDVLLKLAEQLQKAQANLDKVQDEIANSSPLS